MQLSKPTLHHLTPLLRVAGLACALTGAVLAGGCGGFDGVSLQGGVFDALGLSDTAPKKEKEPKVAARPGLVLPPNETSLPPPADKAQVAETEAWPVDPETNKARAAAAADQRHKDFCEKALRNARLRGETGVVIGPKGNCQPGMFGSLTGLFEGEKAQ